MNQLNDNKILLDRVVLETHNGDVTRHGTNWPVSYLLLVAVGVLEELHSQAFLLLSQDCSSRLFWMEEVRRDFDCFCLRSQLCPVVTFGWRRNFCMDLSSLSHLNRGKMSQTIQGQ